MKRETETDKEREKREKEKERKREKERHLKNLRNWRKYRKEKREESGHTVPAPPLFFYPLGYILPTVKPMELHFEPIPLPPFQEFLILCGFYPY